MIRGSDERSMANSLRQSVYHVLTEEEILFVKQEAQAIGVPAETLVFNEGSATGFYDRNQSIRIRGNVFPDEKYGLSARDRMSARAVLAHEYYGHYRMFPSPYPIGSWEDEFWASYRAAIHTPNLTDEDRRYLMIDAYDRAKGAGEFSGYTDEARRIIYGEESV